MRKSRTTLPTDRADLAQALFAESADALFLLDPQADRMIDANPAAQRLTGFRRDELLSLSAAELFRPASPDDTLPLAEALAHADPWHGALTQPRSPWDDFLLRTRTEGVWVPISVTVTRLDVAPRPLGLITARDRREEQVMFETLPASQARLEQVLETTDEGIILVDRDGYVRLANPEAERLCGCDRGALLGRPWGETVAPWRHPDDQLVAPEDRAHVRVLRYGESVSGMTRMRTHPDGSRTVIRGNAVPLRDAIGRIAGMVASFRDVTAQYEAQEELARQHALIRAMFDSIPDLIGRKDTAGIYRGCNPAFAAFFGRSEADICGRTDADLFPPELAATLETADCRVLAGGPPERLEMWVQDRGGQRVLFETLRVPLTAPDGRLLGLLGTSRNITRRRQLEDQLHQAGKMEAVGQLAGGIAHDFNNLLTTLLGHLALVQEQLPAEHPARALLAASEQAAWRAADLTRQLLGFARRTPLQLEPTAPAVCIAETAALLRRSLGPRIAVEVHTDPDLHLMLADAVQISQVLMNLCLNARDAMPDGGTLTLSAANVVVEPRGADATPLAGEFVRLSVADTGSGIPPEVRERLFEPFFTTKGLGQGTGLGLAMVHGIVQQHQGWVEVESEVGRGSRFDVYLPRAK